MPVFSIITPVFNASRWLPEMLASVSAQTFTDWEHILVDDCSTDDSVAVIENAAARDPRIRLLKMESNSGPARARNRAIEAAQGRYIALLDSDDLWLPHKLERCLAFMQATPCAFSYHAFRYASEDMSKVGIVVVGPPRLDLASLHTRRGIHCSAIVIDRQKAKGFRFDESFAGLHEDWLALLSLVQAGHIGNSLPVDLGRYRLPAKSRNANKIDAIQKTWHIYHEVEALSWPQAASWWLQYVWHSFWLHRRSRPRMCLGEER